MNETELENRLASLKAKRGYLLPHHGLMALTAPAPLEAYDALYTALALEDRVLSHHDREFVWLAILIAAEEEIATHHIEKFQKAGGTDEEVRACLALCATVCGFRAYRFIADHWSSHLPGVGSRAEWGRTLLRAGEGAEERLCHMAACAVQVCNGDWKGLRWQLALAYEAGVPEAELAEAISLTMFPASVPSYVTAAQIWKDMIREGAVDASKPFRIWAGLAGQGGHGSLSDG